MTQHLLCFGQAQFPRVARVLDAAQGRCARSTAVPRDVDVVRVSLGHAGGHRPNSKLRDQLHAHGCAWIDALQVVDQLRQVFDAVDIVVRWWTDQRD